ncbi:hypothetical protein KKH23_09695 [Patescibacteria group bacterium]|nr:hypothetical protein [Patescibacteria group bacterium]
MSDLMFASTEPLHPWQKWANLARLESIRADKAERERDMLLTALKAFLEWVDNNSVLFVTVDDNDQPEPNWPEDSGGNQFLVAMQAAIDTVGGGE